MHAVSDRPSRGTPGWVLALWNTPWLWMVVVLVLFCVPLFMELGRADLENDEAIYSFAVETMLKDGDWLTPKVVPSETDPFLEKPPLKFWLTAAPIALGWLPANEVGERVVDAVFGSLALLYVFGIGRRLGGPVAGLSSVLLLFAHQQLLVSHGLRSNNMEAAIVLAYCGGIYHFLAWRSVNPDVKRHIFGMSLFFVLGFMTKFVAALFLPVILVLAAGASHDDRVRVYRDLPAFIMAGLLAVALIAPWFVYEYRQYGQAFIDKIFGEHVMKRFTAYLDPTHLHPWHYYLVELWKELGRDGVRLITLAGAALLAWRTVFRRSTESLVVLLWFAVPIAAISSTTSKLYHYLYPFLPPVALAGGILLAWLGRWLFRLMAGPADAFERARRRVLGRLASARAWQIGATAGALVAFGIAAATYGFDRINVHLGNVVLRNSSVVRPVVASIGLLMAGAPPACIRAALAGLLLLPIVPLGGYHYSMTRMRDEPAPYRSVRDCLAPIVAREIAAGRPAPGVWIESAELSHIPFYYFRALGPWQRRDYPSNQTVAMHLIVPDRYRPVLLSEERYVNVFRWIVDNRSAALARASTLSGVDVTTLGTSLDNTTVTVVTLQNTRLLLPGPYAACGVDRVQLGSR